MSEPMDPAKMKVVELRAELSNRGLDTKGNKATLVDRLKEVLEKETGRTIEDTSILDTSSEDLTDTSIKETKAEPPETVTPTRRRSEVKTEPAPSPVTPKRQEPPPVVKTEAAEPAPAMTKVKEEPKATNVKQEKGAPDVKKETEAQKKDVKEETEQAKMETDSDIVEIKTEADVKEEPRDRQRERDDRRGEKRRRSPSPRRRNSPQRRPDDEPELDENAAVLGWYDSDLNIVIGKEKYTTATPMHEQGFGYIWAGARCTYGILQGKACFEVKLLEELDVSHLEDEPTPHVLRVGWSVTTTSMQLGEEKLSYGYGGTGKASTDCNFKNYGKPFLIGDVVGAFLDMDSEPIIMSFSVNGEGQGVAYEISRAELQNQALFPHVLTKNIKFECNFGAQEPWFPLLEGYPLIGQLPVEKRVSGPKRPEKREDCEMIMMCGLPGCGKTTWANEWYAKNLSKNYNILGTNNLIDKMKVMGLPRKRNYAGRWDVLIDKCTKCLVKLLDIAARRRRNYILDQTNVYPTAQRRKMRGFEGFVRRAVVIVPTDEEFKKRIEKREKVEGKDVPDSAVLEMKANFMLPEVGDIFSEVMYTELGESETRPLVEQYNKEGRDAGYGGHHNKRPRFDNRDRDRDRPYRGGGGGSSGGGYRPRGGSSDRSRSGGWQPRGGSDHRGGGGGWRDRQASGGGYRSDRGGGWRGGRGGRGDSHSRGSYDRNRSSGGRSRSPSAGSGKGTWGGSQGSGGGGGNSWGGASGNSGGGSGGWGQQQQQQSQQQSYNQQGWGQQNYNQQGWKGYGQQASYGQQSYGQQGYNQQAGGYGNGNSYPNWNQQQYYNQAYGAGTQNWGQ